MEAKEFIEKWLVGYEDLEHKAELSIEMETDLIEYANQSKWISAETLPEKETGEFSKINVSKSVLGLCVLRFGCTCQIECWYDFDYKEWHSEIEDNLNITHWQPLPTEPCQTT